MVKLLVVDDSALMRKFVRAVFEERGGFEVRTARNGKDALEQIPQFDPDVITLDVNMPEMDGLTCLSEIMATNPKPVVMLSSITTEGAVATLEALQLGAVDWIAKPGGTVSLNIDEIADEIRTKVRAAARARPRRALGLASRVRRAAAETCRRPALRSQLGTVGGVVVVGVSTGGPRTLEDILPALPADLPWPVVIAQHMPMAFTGPFAARLNRLCQLEVVEASEPTPLTRGRIYIGRGDMDVVVESRLGRKLINAVPSDPNWLWHPSVDRLVRSAMKAFEAPNVIGIELTGMGNDGAEAMRDLKAQGGRTIAESESSAIVFGMPGELVRLGGATTVLAAGRIPAQIAAWLM
ncbi:chemotaxis-specific protein-glutamate methyltransferase CheB [Blastochloris sulfoviridis]|uniref:Protein-glutamate methylesterase/protein-glutamine glutaminase n=1 Tax=Blastochloris sulfoviridis TaxID=50712 RepID=A0A5M6HVJ4_9HYPH|nr:chemotaxis-specific protein-glutamate methyltransferase CheB [Blastochloris sulfoviridis]KAA5599920.1 chemotaxis-specific protein-glutamate methyltransferase CheB [Blastochloris sulfoviridis]